MRNPNGFVARVTGVTAQGGEARSADAAGRAGPTIVRFEGGRSGVLDTAYPRAAHWAGILERRAEAGHPVYVELDPDSTVITRLLVPEPARVHALDPLPGGDVAVRLFPSHVVHRLLRAGPGFEEMEATLRSALGDGAEVLVTATRDEHEIVDVRVPAPEERRLVPRPLPPDPPPDPPVSQARAQQLFEQMNALTCSPCTATAPCITFLFPDDGCYARAHEMCRLMFDEGEAPEKVWIFGSLSPASSNHPDCGVVWWYHVAPTLTVTTMGGDEKRVIDPSLCTSPVTPDEWKALQGDPAATFQFTDATPFWPNNGGNDPDYSLTNQYLQEKRDLLIDRCLDFGPPPYACPLVTSLFFIVDRNTFSQDEVAAMLALATSAVVQAAFFVVADGFVPADLGVTAATLAGVPDVKPALSMAPGVAQMTADAVKLAVEHPANLGVRQRMTWTYDVTFAGTGGFTAELLAVALSASLSTLVTGANLYLIKQPNPYEVDGPVSWLSTDLRVFQVPQGQSKFGAMMGADAPAFITQVLQNLNAGNTGGQTFENDLSTDQQTSQLELSQTVGGTAVYNFAVARVRYRALAVSAPNVRAFFRLFQTSSTSLAFNPGTTYRRGGQGGVTIPLPGVQGGKVVTIPCFAAPRVDATAVSLNAQTDPENVKPIPPDASGNEVVWYFGCWLDINQPAKRLPLQPAPLDGPWPAASLQSIQDLVRFEHQCLALEIAFDPAPIPGGASPSTSDKLGQRNLAIVQSANPGAFASHRIPLTFEIRPTPRDAEDGEPADELMLDWGETPVGSLATIYLPGADADEILRLAVEMYRTHRLMRVDAHTLQCRTGGVTYLPVPRGHGADYAGLLTVDLPADVKWGQSFTIVARQVTRGTPAPERPDVPAILKVSTPGAAAEGGGRRVLGSFQLTIPVRHKEEMLPREERLLANLRSIHRSIPRDDRWFPVFDRYVAQVAARVDALGGDSAEVPASPSDTWRTKGGDGGTGGADGACGTFAALAAVLLGLLVVALGALTGTWLAMVSLVLLVALVMVGVTWTRRCRPGACPLLRAMAAGAAGGAFILALLRWIGIDAPQLGSVLVASAVLAVAATVAAWMRGCFKP